MGGSVDTSRRVWRVVMCAWNFRLARNELGLRVELEGVVGGKCRVLGQAGAMYIWKLGRTAQSTRGGVTAMAPDAPTSMCATLSSMQSVEWCSAARGAYRLYRVRGLQMQCIYGTHTGVDHRRPSYTCAPPLSRLVHPTSRVDVVCSEDEAARVARGAQRRRAWSVAGGGGRRATRSRCVARRLIISREARGEGRYHAYFGESMFKSAGDSMRTLTTPCVF